MPRCFLSSLYLSPGIVVWGLVACTPYQEFFPGETAAGATSGGADESSGAEEPSSGGIEGGESTGREGTGATASGVDMGTSGDMGTGGRVDPPEPSCEDVTACGGDVLGVWFAVASCLPVTGTADLAPFGIGCSEGDLSGELEVSGNWTVAEDGTISDNTTTIGEIEIKLGSECRNVSGTTVNCGDVAGPLSSIGFTELDCVDAVDGSGGCDCSGTVNQMGGAGYVTFDATTDGIYEVMDNVITTINLISVDYAYCIDGEFMHVTPTTAPEYLGTTNGTIVFQKQP